VRKQTPVRREIPNNCAKAGVRKKRILTSPQQKTERKNCVHAPATQHKLRRSAKRDIGRSRLFNLVASEAFVFFVPFCKKPEAALGALLPGTRSEIPEKIRVIREICGCQPTLPTPLETFRVFAVFRGKSIFSVVEPGQNTNNHEQLIQPEQTKPKNEAGTTPGQKRSATGTKPGQTRYKAGTDPGQKRDATGTSSAQIRTEIRTHANRIRINPSGMRARSERDPSGTRTAPERIRTPSTQNRSQPGHFNVFKQNPTPFKHFNATLQKAPPFQLFSHAIFMRSKQPAAAATLTGIHECFRTNRKLPDGACASRCHFSETSLEGIYGAEN
jgi:hypothetical protein